MFENYPFMLSVPVLSKVEGLKHSDLFLNYRLEQSASVKKSVQ